MARIGRWGYGRWIKRHLAGRPCRFTWRSPLSLSPMFALKRIADSSRTLRHVRKVPIVLQKSQNAVRLNFRQRTKQAVIVDRCRFNRATEVVSEFVTE
jgi:hypothetical protein